MALIMKIFLVITLSVLFIYLKREQTKTLIKKMTVSELFPKIFWGLMLGIGILYLGKIGDFLGGLKILKSINFLNNTFHIRGLHFVGPIFGIFGGITIGASSRPFGIKKMLYCIFTGFIGGFAYTVYMLLSEKPRHIPSVDMFTLLIFVLGLMPFAIGIVDKSFFKAIVGLIGGGVGMFLCLLLLVIGFISGVGIYRWGFPPTDAPLILTLWTRIILGVCGFTGVIFILIGIEFGEFADLKEFKKLKDIFKDIKKVIKE